MDAPQQQIYRRVIDALFDGFVDDLYSFPGYERLSKPFGIQISHHQAVSHSRHLARVRQQETCYWSYAKGDRITTRLRRRSQVNTNNA